MQVRESAVVRTLTLHQHAVTSDGNDARIRSWRAGTERGSLEGRHQRRGQDNRGKHKRTGKHSEFHGAGLYGVMVEEVLISGD